MAAAANTRLPRSLPPVPASTSQASFMEFSMRERMREKLKAARSRAESALLEEVSSPRSLKSFRERKSHIRLVNEVGEDEASFAQEDESWVSARVKLHDSARKMKQKSQIQTGYPSSEEAYNFFTFHFNPEPENTGEETQKKEKNVSDLGDEEVEEQEPNIGHQEEQMEGEMVPVLTERAYLFRQTFRVISLCLTLAVEKGEQNQHHPPVASLLSSCLLSCLGAGMTAWEHQQRVIGENGPSSRDSQLIHPPVLTGVTVSRCEPPANHKPCQALITFLENAGATWGNSAQ